MYGGKDVIVANEDFYPEGRLTFHNWGNMIYLFALQVQQDFGFRDKVFGFANEANVDTLNETSQILYHYFNARLCYPSVYDSAFVVNGEIVWFGTNLMELLENNQVLQYINS